MKCAVRALLLVFALLAPEAHALIYQSPFYPVIEFHNSINGHYVLLDFEEAAAVDRGSAGPGWTRTGRSFSAGKGAGPVCRFYSFTYNSHFFTGDPAECESLKAPGSGWVYEKVAFEISVPTAGACPAGADFPVYRLYNNRHAQRDGNHRFVADERARDAMVARGWRYEGVAFCTVGATGPAPEEMSTVGMASNPPFPWDILPEAQCETRLGSCEALGQLDVMPQHTAANEAAPSDRPNPAFPAQRIAEITGGSDFAGVWSGVLGLMAPTRSFVAHQYSRMGIHIDGRERKAGPYASISSINTRGWEPTYRTVPWAAGRERDLVVSADALVKTFERFSPAAHAYGLHLIQFADLRNDRRFYVTVQAFGSVPPGDFVGTDAKTGRPIVSTVFRADPAFGHRFAGSFVACDGLAGAACLPQPMRFEFRLTRADFAEVLRRARQVDAALSADPSDYRVASHGFHVETYLDARIGLTLDRVRLDIYYPGQYGL